MLCICYVNFCRECVSQGPQCQSFLQNTDNIALKQLLNLSRKCTEMRGLVH